MMPHLSRRRALTAVLFVAAAPLTRCASPPLALYTLEPATGAVPAAALGGHAPVIEVRRVVVPDALDTQDILQRNGNLLVRSAHGRWATRLSVGITQYITGALAARRPDALVTDQPPVEAPDFRINLTISQLDITSAGQATLAANWTIVPRDSRRPTQRDRIRVTASGPVATDQDVVTLMQSLLSQLAQAINDRGLA